MIQPLDQVRSIVAPALSETTKVRKNFEKFFILTMSLILTIYDRINFTSLARNCGSCESRFRQNFKKAFDWCRFNMAFRLKTECGLVAIALDHSFLRKSGKKTPGIGHYWSGCAGAVKRGLEILAFAMVAADMSDARFLLAVQTVALTTRGRTPYYLEHMKDKRDNQTAKCLRAIYENRENLLKISNILVGDCLFASFNFVQGAEALGFNVVSRLRDDAVLQYLYTGPQKGGRGRKKELDGVVDINCLRENVFARETVLVDGVELTVYSAVVKCKSLKRKIKVAIAELSNGGKTIRKIFFSTNTAMSASDIVKIYHSRFQIEFLFRDAKQNTGLEDWQSTTAESLSFGYNASLTAVNIAREIGNKMQQETGRKLSVASVKKVLHNAALYQHIKEFIEGQKNGDAKNKFTLSEQIPDNLLFFGVRDSA